MKNETSKEEQIKKSFDKILGMYPIKNLEDLYDKEGYRDEEFEKDDKGIWLLHSEMSIQRNGGSLKNRGMVLELDRNTRTASGRYIVSDISTDKDDKIQKKSKEYPVKMVDNKIIPTEKIEDSKIREEIEDFKFFGQYANFKGLKDYKDGRISFNPNATNYSAEYQLNNNDYNVKQLRKRYDIPTKKAPELRLKGMGKLNGSSVGYQNIEISFEQKKGENIYFTDSIDLNPSEE